METRLLVRGESGWKALEYVWNDDQTDALLEVAGDRKNVVYVDAEGRKREQEYVIPNLNQCKSCHNRNGTFPSYARANRRVASSSSPTWPITNLS